MSDQSSIEWTDSTWNPTVGCSLIAQGCKNCYAMRMAWRHVLMCRALGRKCKYEGTVELGPDGKARWTGVVRLDTASLSTPLAWKKPRRIFVDSMSDLFHEGLTFPEIASVFAVMAACPQHTFQILTKRPERAAEFFRWIADQGEELRANVGEVPPSGHAEPSACAVFLSEVTGGTLDLLDDVQQAVWPLANVWIGTSIAEQKDADKNIPHLLQVPAAIRFLSVEPMIGPVRLDECAPHFLDGDESNPGVVNAFNAMSWHPKTVKFAPPVEGSSAGVQWCIVGGESGPGARPCNVAWIDSIIAQCAAASVPCFVKQLGAKPVVELTDRAVGDIDEHPMMSWPPDASWSEHDGYAHPLLDDRKGGEWTEWPERLRVRQFPSPVTEETEGTVR